MLEMNSQNTKAIGGSNCRLLGASRFHPNHRTVQITIIRKKPMVPTRSVLQHASLSRVLNRALASLLTLRRGFRCFLNSSSESGLGNFAVEVSLITKCPSHPVAGRAAHVQGCLAAAQGRRGF